MLLTTFHTRTALPIQAANPFGKGSRAPSTIAYVLTDDEQLGEDVCAIIRANGAGAQCFRTSSSYLVHERPEMASCLLIDRRPSAMPERDFQRLLASTDAPPVILLSDSRDIPSCVRAIKDGAHDFLTLPLVTSHLVETIGTAFTKDRDTLAMRREHQDLRNRWRSLTSREAEVMRYVVGGFLNKQTASELRITENTVQVHRGRVMRKMRADSFAALVRMSLKLADWGENSLLPTTTDRPWDHSSALHAAGFAASCS